MSSKFRVQVGLAGLVGELNIQIERERVKMTKLIFY